MPRFMLSIAALILASASTVHAQAFGVAANMAAFEAGAYAQVKDRLLLNPPDPNENFPFYIGRVSQSGEICEVKGTTSQHRDDPRGTAARSQYDQLRRHLEEKYGPGDRNETIAVDSPWDAEKDWVLSLLQGERSHDSAWTANLPTGIERIELAVDGVGIGRSQVTLTYVFDTRQGCGPDEMADSSGL